MSTSNGATLTSAPGELPQAVAVARVAPPETPVAGAELLPTQELPDELAPTLSELTVGTLTLQPDGTLAGDVVEAPAGDYRRFVRATNTGIFIDQEALASLLADEAARTAHQEELLAAAEPYDGVNLDYQGVAIGQKAAFTAFVGELAATLDEAGKELIVTLDAPAAIGGGATDTGGQDWPAIASLACSLRAHAAEPGRLRPRRAGRRLIAWAVRQAPRRSWPSSSAQTGGRWSFQGAQRPRPVQRADAGRRRGEMGGNPSGTLTGDASRWNGTAQA